MSQPITEFLSCSQLGTEYCLSKNCYLFKQENRYFKISSNIKLKVNFEWKETEIKEALDKFYGINTTKKTVPDKWIQYSNNVTRSSRLLHTDRLTTSKNNENV